MTTPATPRETALYQICDLIDSVRTNGAYPAENFIPGILSSARTRLLGEVRELVDSFKPLDRCLNSMGNCNQPGCGFCHRDEYKTNTQDQIIDDILNALSQLEGEQK